MIIRNGFVSNSSSSSFIIPTTSCESIFHLGLKMLKIRNVDWNHLYYKEERKIKQALSKNFDSNIPISFETVGYRTYINLSKDRTKYEVDTCNNYDWDNLDVYNIIYCDLKDLSQPYNHTFYWFPNEGIIGRPLTSDDTKWLAFKKENNINHPYPKCPRHDSYYHLVEDINGNVICMECYKLSNNKDMFLDRVITPPEFKLKPRLKLR